MDPNVINAISTLGFPIVACIALFGTFGQVASAALYKTKKQQYPSQYKSSRDKVHLTPNYRQFIEYVIKSLKQ